MNLEGQRFGRLTVVEKADKDKWKCVCDCGNEKIVGQYSLIHGDTKSCGCLWKERVIKHGHSYERLYHVWSGMRSRCRNPKSPDYKRYGGRGITVCDEWNSYSAFRDWALENGYDSNAERFQCTLDRIDNDKGYSPQNCRWVSLTVNNNNTSSNRFLVFEGEKHTVAEWARIQGLSSALIRTRLDNLHWPIDRALLQPVRSKTKRGHANTKKKA